MRTKRGYPRTKSNLEMRQEDFDKTIKDSKGVKRPGSQQKSRKSAKIRRRRNN